MSNDYFVFLDLLVGYSHPHGGALSLLRGLECEEIARRPKSRSSLKSRPAEVEVSSKKNHSSVVLDER